MSNQRKFKIGEQTETTLRGWSAGKSQKKGTPYVRLVFNHYISKDLWLTKKNMERVMETLELLGFRGTDLSQLSNENALDKEKIVMVTIDESREYNGKTYYQASWINDPDKMFGGPGEFSKDLLDELKGYDTRAYIDGAVDQSQPKNDGGYNVNQDANFASSDIPF